MAVAGNGAKKAPTMTHMYQIEAILDFAYKHPQGITRSDIARHVSLGRNAVEQRLSVLLDSKLLTSLGYGASTGGRQPEIYHINSRIGTVVIAAISVRSTDLAITDHGHALL